jgi:transcriptional regulator GlxA family with amidase domain
MRIQVLALDDVFDLGLSAVLDAFQTANELAEANGLEHPRFELQIVGVRSRVRTAQGFAVPASRIRDDVPDCFVVPAIGFKMPRPLEQALRRSDVREAAAAIGAIADRGCLLAAACIGTFVTAESGVLDGRQATTTWWLARLFRDRYPRVRLDESQMIVRSGRVVTAGAALSHMDLALHIIRTVSPQLASLTASYLIVDSRPSQSAYALTDHLDHLDPVVQRFEAWARARLSTPFSLDEASRATGTSKRTLARRIDAAMGISPLTFFHNLRVERAVHLLRTTDASLDRIATEVGYAEPGALRALLRRSLNLRPKDIRPPLRSRRRVDVAPSRRRIRRPED